MNKKLLVKVLTICVLALTVTPIVTLTVQSKISTGTETPAIMAEDTKLYKFLLYKKGTLGNIIDIDTYHFQMKEGKTYLLRSKFDVPSGTFTMTVAGPGGADGKTESWDTDDAKSARQIQFLFIPTDTGNYTITLFALFTLDVSTYSLYVNQDGFAGWWWMLAVGVGALLIVVIGIVLIARAVRPKKRRRRR